MFEPFSALAVLGFAAGTLGFIVSTISKIDEKFQDVQEYEKRLRSFKWQLEDVYMELRVWHSIWVGRKAFPLQTYIHFWGLDGMANIDSRVKGITELSNEIKRLLRHPVTNETGFSLRGSEIEDWHQLIGDDTAKVLSSPCSTHEKAGLVRKVAFTLFHNATLLEKISRLKTHVNGLREFTQSTFRLRQWSDHSRVTASELHHISDLNNFIDRISSTGRSLYGSRSPLSRFEWTVEIGSPDPKHALHLWTEVDAVHVDFMVRETALHVQTKASRVRVRVDKLSTLPDRIVPLVVQRVDDVALCYGQRETHSKYDCFFDMLEKPTRRSRPLRKLITEGVFSGKNRKSFEVERADLVYGLGHWMVLLWNTPWSSDLCTCGIRYIHLLDARTRHSFLPCPKRGSHCFPECHPSKLAENRSELLGVALSEIALALPISVIPNQEENDYLVDNEELASRKRLLSMLRERFGRNTITKAVSYCLDPHQSNKESYLRPDHFEQYCENVVRP